MVDEKPHRSSLPGTALSHRRRDGQRALSAPPAAVASLALDQAARRDLVARNVAALSVVPSGPTKVKRALTVEQAAVLLDAARTDRLEVAYLATLLLGFRRGETLGLGWDNVDLDAATVRIVQALKVERGAPVLGPLETAGSRRTLAVPAPLVIALRTHHRAQLEERVKLGAAWQDSRLVFTTTIGTPIHPRSFARSFEQLCARAGLGHWTPNELRHPAVSLLSAAGLRAEDIADIVGHVGTRMTTQVYRHQVTPTITAGKEAMERLFLRFGGEFGGQFGGQTGATGN